MKTVLAASLLLCRAILGTAEVTVIVPQVIGNARGIYPFLIQQSGIPSLTMRYQQVYAASAFAAISPYGAYITNIFVNGAVDSDGAIGGSTNCQINLSTTSKQPDSLSLVFAENVGPDDTIVFGPAPIDSRSGPKFSIPLSRTFWYNPTNGNLLMDVRIYNGGFPLPSQFFLAVQVDSGDSVSSIYAESIDAMSATRVDTSGLVTLFQIIPTPALLIHQTTNSVVINWLVQPDVFVLQSTDKVGPTSNWQQVTNEIDPSSAPFRTLALPRDALGATKFFRLICESCQPAFQTPVAPLLESKSITPNTH